MFMEDHGGKFTTSQPWSGWRLSPGPKLQMSKPGPPEKTSGPAPENNLSFPSPPNI